MRITGTHIYHVLHCPHAVALDLHEDPAKRRPPNEVEEFVRRRGRDWEAKFVAGLGYPEPEYERGDFAFAAEQTEAFLRDGVDGVSQGVLREESKLGIPDLLRREAGASDLGAFHYVVGDIKSSRHPRSDQLMQVLFYSRMLAKLQGRSPEYAYLILKDGGEERFVLADYAAAIDEVEERVLAIADDPTTTTPFRNRSCAKCRWSEVCLPQLQEHDDLSLVQGMTRGLRTTLHRIGVERCADLAVLAVEGAARKSHLEAPLLRRLKKAAQARMDGQPLRQQRSRQRELGSAAILHHLYDAYTERMLFFGAQYPARPDGEFFSVCPRSHDDELDCFTKLIERLPKYVPLLHYGEGLPRWYTNAVGKSGIESRFVDLARRVRGAAIYPGPVFGVAQYVEYLLGVDPHREGDADAAGMWAERSESGEWLTNKGRSDLTDLCGLVEAIRDEPTESAKASPPAHPARPAQPDRREAESQN